MFLILLVMWMLGMVTAYTMGGSLHILLVLAPVVVVIQLLSAAEWSEKSPAQTERLEFPRRPR
jgi:hypothetical protein